MLISQRHLIDKMGKKQQMVKALEEKERGYVDYEVADFCDLEIEQEDRDVGIFGNTFILNVAGWFEDDKQGGRDLQLVFGDEDMDKLLDIFKPYYERMKNEEQWAKEEEKRWQEEQNEGL